MNDEFEVNVDDGSVEEVAAQIIELRKLTAQGDFEEVDRMYKKWIERQKKGGSSVKFQKVERGADDDDTDWDSDDLEDAEDDDDEDVEMDEAPALAQAPKEKVAPQVDEDGFTAVVSKKKR